jgi:hypothetical protein
MGKKRILVCAGVCTVGLTAAASARMVAANGSAVRTVIPATTPAAPPQFGAAPSRKPFMRAAWDGRRAALVAEHKGLTVQKITNKADRSVIVELRFRSDAVVVAIDARRIVTVSRGGESLRVTSPEALAKLQTLLTGSEAAFAARLLLAERELTSELKPPEMSLLSAAAFVASLMGDVDAPRRLSTRFVEKHLGIFRPVRFDTCWDTYTRESSAAWNDMQACMNEANQDESLINRAYRRVACNAIWLLRAESAWIEYLGCLGPGQLFPN